MVVQIGHSHWSLTLRRRVAQGFCEARNAWLMETHASNGGYEAALGVRSFLSVT
jgi:hypothetical protein